MSNDLAFFGTDSTSHVGSTLALDTTENKNRALRALNSAESLAAVIVPDRDTMDVVDIFQTPGLRRSRIEGVDDTPCRNTYFLLADGRALMSQSDGIARSCDMLLAIYPDCGRSTDKGCLTLAVHERKLSNGNTIKSVYPVD
jgi:hypothetical protein